MNELEKELTNQVTHPVIEKADGADTAAILHENTKSAPEEAASPEEAISPEEASTSGEVSAPDEASASEEAPVGADRLELAPEGGEKEEPAADTAEEEMAEKPDYAQEILALVKSNASPKLMRDELESYHDKDIAEVLPELSLQQRKKVYRILDNANLSDILEYLEEEDAALYLEEMDPKKAAAVVTELEPDDAVEILRKIPRDRRALLIDLLDEKSRNDVRLIASFDEDEIGSRMTTNYIAIRENLTIKEAMSELVRQAADNDNISTIFVLDETGAFYGAIDLKDLIIARQSDKLDDLVVTSFPYVYGHESVDECIEKLKDYSEDNIPILDNSNRLIGIITSTDIIEVVDEAYGEDYARLAGLTAEEDLNEPLLRSMKKRLPWLITLLILGLGVSTVVGAFERVVERLTIVMAFQSMILDMSGNTGTQSLAVTIRVLTDESLNFRQKIKFVFKEVRTGLTNGFIMGLTAIVLVGLYIHILKGRPLEFSFLVSGCIGVSMMIAMTISSLLGTGIPMIFKKLHIDPAVASGPLITTTNDFVAVITYYSLCWVLLIGVFHLG